MKCETVLTKDYSNMVKGMAVLMMIMHHIWGFPEKIPALPLSNFEVQLGAAGKICVSIFMFISGYGLYYSFEKKDTIRVWYRVWKVYKRFWQVFLIFVPIGFLYLSKPFAVQEFLANLFCLKFSYNQEWWFLGTYIELLLVLPVMLIANQKKYFPYLIVGLSVLLRGLSGIVNLNSGGASSHIYYFCYYFPSFFLGLLFCKYSLYERFRAVVAKESLCLVICLVLTGMAFVVRSKFGITETTIVMTPLCIYLFVVFFRKIGRANQVFLFFGKHSMNMWLIHSFFCYYYFQKEMLMVSNNAIVDYVLLVAVSLIVSIVIDKIWNNVDKFYTTLKS